MPRTEEVSATEGGMIPEGVARENLSIELTTRCTGACVHCFARAARMDQLDMPRGTALDILTEGREAGFRHLHLTGGEPLLWPWLYEVIDMAFSVGYETVFLNSNGMLLTKQRCARLANYGRGLSLSVSLQGPRQMHERFRGVGSWKRAADGLTRALDAGLDAEVFTAAGKGLLPCLPDFTEFVFRRFPRVRQLTLIQLIRVALDAFDLSGELMDPADFMRFVRTCGFLNLRGFRVHILENPLARVVADALGMPWFPGSLPLSRSGRLVIMADLAMTLSHSSREPVGLYEPGAIQRVLSSEPYARLVAPDEEVCPTCRHFSMCRNNELTRPSEWYRDMHPEVPFCKRVLAIAVDGIGGRAGDPILGEKLEWEAPL